eukprot:1327421-Amphidinium_carterae.3
MPWLHSCFYAGPIRPSRAEATSDFAPCGVMVPGLCLPVDGRGETLLFMAICRSSAQLPLCSSASRCLMRCGLAFGFNLVSCRSRVGAGQSMRGASKTMRMHHPRTSAGW